MNIVHVTTTDPAGSVINFVNAVNRHTPHRARLITTNRIEEYDFPADLHWIMDGGDEMFALLEQADVIHLHKVDNEFELEVDMPKLGVVRKLSIAELLKQFPQKKVVYHIHGHPYERGNVEENAANYKALGGRVLCSTPDLEEMYKPHYDGVQYFPNCVPVNDVTYLPRPVDAPILGSDGVARYLVSQTPTHAVLKNCHVIEQAVRNVAKKHPVAYDKAWNLPQHFALRRKRISSVVFDHIEGYYGLSSLEGLSMGKPVIAGLSDYTICSIASFFGITPQDLPWVVARDQQQIEEKLDLLFSDEAYRHAAGKASRKFMEEVWSDRVIGQRLAAFYSSL
jgi:glycosyltransferase involved in cell wall biosynthesis